MCICIYVLVCKQRISPIIRLRTPSKSNNVFLCCQPRSTKTLIPKNRKVGSAKNSPTILCTGQQAEIKLYAAAPFLHSTKHIGLRAL